MLLEDTPKATLHCTQELEALLIEVSSERIVTSRRSMAEMSGGCGRYARTASDAGCRRRTWERSSTFDKVACRSPRSSWLMYVRLETAPKSSCDTPCALRAQRRAKPRAFLGRDFIARRVAPISSPRMLKRYTL